MFLIAPLTVAQTWMSFHSAVPSDPEIKLLESDNTHVKYEVIVPGMWIQTVNQGVTSHQRLEIIGSTKKRAGRFTLLASYIFQYGSPFGSILKIIAVKGRILSLPNYYVSPIPVVITTYENGMAQFGETYTDSIWVVTELIGIQMAAGLIENGGGLDEAVASNIPMSLRVTSMAQGLKLEQDILSSMNNDIKSEPQQVEVPSRYQLYQNYPNPFNPNTEIKFDLPDNIHIELAIYNTLGQKVTTLINEERAAGAYRVIWDSKNTSGLNVASGVYIYQIKAGNFVQSRKMMLIR
jgi:hypothetical protein